MKLEICITDQKILQDNIHSFYVFRFVYLFDTDLKTFYIVTFLANLKLEYLTFKAKITHE